VAVAKYIVVVVSACSAPANPSPNQAKPPPKLPAGRDAAVLTCGTATLERHAAACDAVDVDGSGSSIDPPPLPHLPTDAERRQAAARCAQHRVKVCGVQMEGPPGSQAQLCRDPKKLVTGAVRLVAPDGSVLVEGACVANVPTGAWIWWRAGRVEHVIGYDGGRARGVVLDHANGVYRSDVLLEAGGL
jgi:hypothetical protein